MRIILLAIVVIIGTNLALKSYDRVDKIQQEKMQQLCQIDPDYCIPQWTITPNQSIRTSIKKSSKIINLGSQSLVLFLIQFSSIIIMLNNNDINRIQQQSIELLELIEDTSEHFCDEHLVSGEQFYVMMKALVDCKLKEFPLDFKQLEEDIYES